MGWERYDAGIRYLWPESNVGRKARKEAWAARTPTRWRRRVRPRLELEEGDTSEERAHGVSERREGRCVAALGQLAC